jgi:hypothetical protein
MLHAFVLSPDTMFHISSPLLRYRWRAVDLVKGAIGHFFCRHPKPGCGSSCYGVSKFCERMVNRGFGIWLGDPWITNLGFYRDGQGQMSQVLT